MTVNEPDESQCKDVRCDWDPAGPNKKAVWAVSALRWVEAGLLTGQRKSMFIYMEVYWKWPVDHIENIMARSKKTT